MSTTRFAFSVFILRFAAATAAVLAVVVSTGAARADADTEHMFGFTEGTDIGVVGHPEAELETIGAFGRSGGSYSARSAAASLKYPLTDYFRLAPSATFTRFDSSGVPGVDDRNAIVAERVALEFRWRTLARETAPVGLTFVATPFQGFVDGATGAPADAWGGTLIAAVDRALVADRLFGALNLTYDFGRVHDHGSGLTTDASVLGFSAAVSTRLTGWFYAGGEARYERTFDRLGFGTLTGQAVNVGPVFYMTLGEGASLSGGWNIQAWGESTGAPNGLDLDNFTRHLVKVRLAVEI